MIWIAVVLVAGLGVFTTSIVRKLVQEKKALQEKCDAAITACSAVVVATDPADKTLAMMTGCLMNNAIRLCRDVVDIERSEEAARRFRNEHAVRDLCEKHCEPDCGSEAPQEAEVQHPKCNYVVHMSYPAELFFESNVVEEMIQRVAGPSYATTQEYDKRAHTWHGRSEVDACKMVDQLKALPVEGSDVEYREI